MLKIKNSELGKLGKGAAGEIDRQTRIKNFARRCKFYDANGKEVSYETYFGIK